MSDRPTVMVVDDDPNIAQLIRLYLEKEDFRLFLGDVCTDGSLRGEIGGEYDIVVANILPQVLIPLCPFLEGFAKKDGVIIFSGILTEKKEGVIKALREAGFDIISEKEEKEWSALVSVCGGDK